MLKGNLKIRDAINAIVAYHTLPPQIDYAVPFKRKAIQAENFLKSLKNGAKYLLRAKNRIENYWESDIPELDAKF